MKFKLLITGLPRSGTTIMWRICKELVEYPIFYEPFNLACLENTQRYNPLHKTKLWEEYGELNLKKLKGYFHHQYTPYIDLAEIIYFSEFAKEIGKDFGIKENRFVCKNTNFNPERQIFCKRDRRAIWASINRYKKGIGGRLNNFLYNHIWNQIKGLDVWYIKKAKEMEDIHRFLAIYVYYSNREPDNAFDISYEALCGNTTYQIAKIAEYLGKKPKSISFFKGNPYLWKACFTAEEFAKKERELF